MDGQNFMKAIAKCFFIQFLLVSAVQHRAGGMHCTSHCVCKFDDILEHNMATCSFNNTTVDITWKNSFAGISLRTLRKYRFGDITLELICMDDVENYQHDCNSLPQFNISSNEGALSVTGCAPSIMKCAHKIFTPVTNIINVNAKMMAGALTADDLIDFDHIYIMDLHLKNDTVMQAVTINTLKSIEYLTMEGGNLQLYFNMLKFPNLTFLELKQNNIQDLPPNAFNGLPKLKALNILSNNFEYLGANVLKGLDSLDGIFFDKNSLTTIDPTAFSNTKQLFSLFIGNNRLKMVPNGLFTGLNELYQVTITENQVEMTLDTHVFANLPPSVRVIDLSQCNIKYLPEYIFSGSDSITHLILKSNQIELLPAKIFATTISVIDIDLRGNRIQNLPDGIFYELKQLQSIDLSYNHLSVLRGDIFTRNTQLKFVELNDNKLTYIDRETFKGLDLINLNLASNKMQRIIGSSSVEWHIKKLNLKDNELNVFEDWFVELVGLKKLDLLGNKIKMIKEIQLYQFKGVADIDLRNNDITEIVPDTSVPRANVTAADVILRLSNNPIQCDGIVTALLKEWHERGILLDYEDITCDNGEKLSQSHTN